MNKLITLLLICVLVLTGCGGGSTETTAGSSVPVTTAAESEEETLFDAETREASAQALEDAGIDVGKIQKTYLGDKTGNWRLARIACSEMISDYALDYYKAYFESNDEIHIVVNFSLNTTTCIKVSGTDLSVDVYDYVDSEENDASIALTGTHLKSYLINLETGETEEV